MIGLSTASAKSSSDLKLRNSFKMRKNNLIPSSIRPVSPCLALSISAVRSGGAHSCTTFRAEGNSIEEKTEFYIVKNEIEC